MQEKEMISDYLAGLNASLAAYGGIISQLKINNYVKQFSK